MFVTIFRRTAADYWRKHGRESSYEELEHLFTDEQALNRDLQRREAFYEALSGVRPIYRQLLTGMYIEGKNTSELMAQHNLPKGTIAGYMSRAKDELRQLIQSDPEYADLLPPKSFTTCGVK